MWGQPDHELGYGLYHQTRWKQEEEDEVLQKQDFTSVCGY